MTDDDKKLPIKNKTECNGFFVTITIIELTINNIENK